MSEYLRLWPLGSKVIKMKNKMTQTHSVSFWPTSFPQPLSEMSGPVPQGMRSWGNGVRAKGAEQPEREWEGVLRERMRLWEQSREGGLALNLSPTLVASLSLHPCPITPEVTVAWILTFGTLTHFVPCCSPLLSILCLVISLVHSPSFRLGDVHSLTLLFLSVGIKFSC